MKHHYIVCYDIANNKRRYQVDKVLAQYGCRIQLSVYDIVLNQWQLANLRAQIKQHIVQDEDRVHYYPLCCWCRKNTRRLGSAFLDDSNNFTCVC